MNRTVGMVFFLCSLANFSWGLSAEEIFQLNQGRLLQIKLVEIESQSKSSLGSGFVVGDGLTIATNYHVVSQAVSSPGKYRIEFFREDGSEGVLSLYDIDIINDLALLKSEVELDSPLFIAQKSSRKGAKIFALGNPMDLGMTVVPGTYNGLTEHSFYQRIHFSGSVNSGMSGGPVLNEQGDVVGINVATAGNQMSFLIPAEKLQLLLDSSDEQPEKSLIERAASQLEVSQKHLIDRLLDESWEAESLGNAKVPGEVGNVVSCWGRSTLNDAKKKDDAVIEISKGCSLQDSIFINRQMTSGSIEYEFYWFESKNLDDRRFYRYLEKSMSGYPANKVGKDDATEFKCEEAFTLLPNVKIPAEQVKSILCARRYKEFSSLFDVFYFRFAKRDNKALISHFTLAGVTQKSANRFSSKFLENIIWQ